LKIECGVLAEANGGKKGHHGAKYHVSEFHRLNFFDVNSTTVSIF